MCFAVSGPVTQPLNIGSKDSRRPHHALFITPSLAQGMLVSDMHCLVVLARQTLSVHGGMAWSTCLLGYLHVHARVHACFHMQPYWSELVAGAPLPLPRACFAVCYMRGIVCGNRQVMKCNCVTDTCI